MRVISLILGIMMMTTLVQAKSASSDDLIAKHPFHAVQLIFAGVSAFDHELMNAMATDDFQLLEVGEVWDMDDFTAVVKRSSMVRRNYFSIIKSDINENFAWVNYWNKATYIDSKVADAPLREVAWLESAIMVKTAKGWKVQQLHSTRIKVENLPKNIELVEFKL